MTIIGLVLIRVFRDRLSDADGEAIAT